MTPPLPKVDPAAVAHLQAVDPVLATVIRRVGPCVVQRPRKVDLFAALFRSIIYQQPHSKAAAAIYARVVAALPELSPAAVLAAPEATLRAAGLSAAKWRAVRDLAVKAHEGVVPTAAVARRLDDAALVSRLTTVRGVGEWTVHMLLIFHLGRSDVLPAGDFAIRKAFRLLYHAGAEVRPSELVRQAECWWPFCSVASWYLWRSLDPEVASAMGPQVNLPQRARRQ